MNEEQLLKILLAPHLSEKSASTTGQYVFRVANEATKLAVKKAVEKQFNVVVKSVRVCHTKSKPARFGRIKGKHRGWKKAYVTLAEGNQIDMAVGD